MTPGILGHDCTNDPLPRRYSGRPAAEIFIVEDKRQELIRSDLQARALLSGVLRVGAKLRAGFAVRFLTTAVSGTSSYHFPGTNDAALSQIVK